MRYLPTPHLKVILIVLTLIACAAVTLIAPIPQDTSYHEFADQRGWGVIPNFWNVVSNLGFLWVGASGLYQLHALQRLNVISSIKLSYSVFFVGVTLVAFGSGYYHWSPSNETLIWDRLPMTLAFMALMSFALGEFLSPLWAKRGLFVLLLSGIVSVLYWYWGEARGAGDLRPYILVQFLPMILLLVLFVLGKPVFDNNSGYWWLLIAYVAAKITEHFDAQIFVLTEHIMAGHAMKHVLAALGLYALLRCFAQRVQRLEI
jgi:Ceramidase